MLLRATTRIAFESLDPVPMILLLHPRCDLDQSIIEEAHDLEPHVELRPYTDVFGNICHRLIAPQGSLVVTVSCDVETPDVIERGAGVLPMPIEDLPDSVFQFLLPSRYCESDKLQSWALDVVEGVTPGYDQAEAIRTWVQANVAYVPGSSNSSTSACDTLTQREGVCRDQAHLAIALCRALDLPARMVAGYLVDLVPMDLHAWFECYIGGRWWTFDAKEPMTEAGRIVIAYGRDAADIALVTQFGPAELRELQVTVERL